MTNSSSVDLLIRIKNGYRATRKTILATNSKYCLNILELLKKYGFVEKFSVTEDKKEIEITLIYQNNIPVLTDVKLFSKPGRYLYEKSSSIPWGQNKNSLIIISTSSGLMSQKEATKRKIGGTLIAEIY